MTEQKLTASTCEEFFNVNKQALAMVERECNSDGTIGYTSRAIRLHLEAAIYNLDALRALVAERERSEL